MEEPTNEFEKLEGALFSAGRDIAYPATPPLSARVLSQLASAPVPRWLGVMRVFRRRGALLAAIAIVITLALVLANPAARQAVADILGLRSVRIIETGPAPTPAGAFTPQPTPTAGVAPITGCCAVTLEEAQRRAAFKISLPQGEKPSQVFFSDFSPGSRTLQQVILVFGNPQSRRYTLFEAQSIVYGKLIFGNGTETSEGTLVDRTTVNGHDARWLSGAPHVFAILDATDQPEPRTERPVSANTLVWEQGDVTYRLETTLAEAEAVGVAESISKNGN